MFIPPFLHPQYATSNQGQREDMPQHFHRAQHHRPHSSLPAYGKDPQTPGRWGLGQTCQVWDSQESGWSGFLDCPCERLQYVWSWSCPLWRNWVGAADDQETITNPVIGETISSDHWHFRAPIADWGECSPSSDAARPLMLVPSVAQVRVLFHLHKSIIERLSSYKRLRIKSLRRTILAWHTY